VETVRSDGAASGSRTTSIPVPAPLTTGAS
jgi:hypothetical protein